MVAAEGSFSTFSASRSSENTFAALKNKERSSQNSLLFYCNSRKTVVLLFNTV